MEATCRLSQWMGNGRQLAHALQTSFVNKLCEQALRTRIVNGLEAA
jgi:hypothetical protein